MEHTFPSRLADLRRRSGKSQRKVAADLGISQALLSHYETGAREPGLAFLCRACDYYGVTADYLLGRPEMQPMPPVAKDTVRSLAASLRALSAQASALLEELE